MSDYSQSDRTYETYTVAEGDTLPGISKRFRVSQSWLRQINNLSDDTLTAGRMLRIRCSGSGPSAIIDRGRTSCNEIALTYDCGGPTCGDTQDLLEILSRNNVKATFFLVGEWAEAYPQLVRAIVDGGHEIGNHTYSHSDFTQISEEEIKTDIRRGEDAIRRVAGVETCPLLRYPYGYFNEQALAAAGSMGYSHSIQWSVDPRDWEEPPLELILSRVLPAAQAGDIVLLHSYAKDTPHATEIIVRFLTGMGLRFVTVSELIQTV